MNRWAVVVLALVLAACGSDASTAPTTVAGTWALQTINAAPLPFVVAQSGADKAEVLADTLKLSAAGSAIESTTIRTTLNGVVNTQTLADTGSYTVNGSAVTLLSTTEGSALMGTWSGNTITASVEGFTFVYKR